MSHIGGRFHPDFAATRRVQHRVWDGFATGGLSVDRAASLTRAGFGFALGAISGVALGLMPGL